MVAIQGENIVTNFIAHIQFDYQQISDTITKGNLRKLNQLNWFIYLNFKLTQTKYLGFIFTKENLLMEGFFFLPKQCIYPKWLLQHSNEADEINIGQIETASGPHYAIKVKIYEAKEKKPNICRSKYLDCELRPLLPGDRTPAVLRHIVLAID